MFNFFGVHCHVFSGRRTCLMTSSLASLWLWCIFHRLMMDWSRIFVFPYCEFQTGTCSGRTAQNAQILMSFNYTRVWPMECLLEWNLLSVFIQVILKVMMLLVFKHPAVPSLFPCAGVHPPGHHAACQHGHLRCGEQNRDVACSMRNCQSRVSISEWVSDNHQCKRCWRIWKSLLTILVAALHI